MKRIDDLPVEKFDIMLVDVEGREYETIKGAAKKISKNKPIIIIEIWENPKRKQENMLTTKEEVLAYINNLDYKLVKQLNDNYILHCAYENGAFRDFKKDECSRIKKIIYGVILNNFHLIFFKTTDSIISIIRTIYF